MIQKTSFEEIKSYYGQTLKTNGDLKTSACCSADSVPIEHRAILNLIDNEVLEKFYGCGSPIPPVLEGKTVLDLGCGSGRDVFLLSKLVGASGHVIGVDMTQEQLSVAMRHVETHRQRFGFKKSNVTLHHGYIENLNELGIKDQSVDVVVSNCVINLSPDKNTVFSEIFRVLKPGGELYFSDIFADRRIPEILLHDALLRGECLAGALYTEDFRRLLLSMGCRDYRVVSSSPIELNDPVITAKMGMVKFNSLTIRAFHLAELEDRCEDYGHVAAYLGTIPEARHAFRLDDHHFFLKGKPELVCANTAAMLSKTRFGAHFKISGGGETHFGLFDCGPAAQKIMQSQSSLGGACC